MSNTALIERVETRMSGFSDDMSEFEVLVQTYLRDVQYTTTTQAILNIVYSLINVGLVALPYAAAQGGIPLYISTIILVSIVSGYTNCIVISMANEHKVRTLEDLTDRAFGYKGYFIVCFLQIIFSLSLMCITLQVWGDICYTILNNRLSIELPLLNNRNSAIVLGAIVVFPFCLFAKNMKTLKWTSYCSALLVITALLSVVVSFSYYYIENSHSNVTIESDVINIKNYGWTVAFIVTFCFSYNQKIFSIYRCLRRRNTARWKYTVKRSHIIIAVLYSIFGVFGFLSKIETGDKLEFNYFTSSTNMLATDLAIYDISRSILAFSLLLTYPVDCLVAVSTFRHVFRRYIKQLNNCTTLQGRFKDSGSDKTDNTDKETSIHNSVQGNTSSRKIPIRNHGSAPFDDNSGVEDGLGRYSQTSSFTNNTSSYQSSYMVRSFSGSEIVSSSLKSDGKGRYERVSDLKDNRLVNNESSNHNWDHSSLLTSHPNKSLTCDSLHEVNNNTIKTISISNLASLEEENNAVNSGHSINSVKFNLNSDISEVNSISSSLSRSSINSSNRSPSNSKDGSVRLSIDGSVTNDEWRRFDDELLKREEIEKENKNKKLKQIMQTRAAKNIAKQALEYGDDWVGPSTDEMIKLLNSERLKSMDQGSLYEDDEDDESNNNDDDGSEENSVDFENRVTSRLSSIGNLEHLANGVIIDPTKQYFIMTDGIPGVFFWSLGLLITFIVGERWILVAAAIGTFATALLVFVIPSMLYFRLGIREDYQVTPMFGYIPNRVYMLVIQLIGVSCLLGEVFLLLYSFKYKIFE